MIYLKSLNKLITMLSMGATVCIANLSGNISTEAGMSVRFIYTETIHGKTQKYERTITKSEQIPYETTVYLRDYTGQKVTIEGKNLSITEERKEPENIAKIRIARNDQNLIEVSLISDSDNTPHKVLYVCGWKVKICIFPAYEVERLRHSPNSGSLEQTEIYKFNIGDSTYQTKVVIQGKEFYSQIQTCPTIEIYGIDLHTQEENDQLPPATIIAQINTDNDMLEVNVQGNKGEGILTATDYDPENCLPEQSSTPPAINILIDRMTRLAHRIAHFLPGF